MDVKVIKYGLVRYEPKLCDCCNDILSSQFHVTLERSSNISERAEPINICCRCFLDKEKSVKKAKENANRQRVIGYL